MPNPIRAFLDEWEDFWYKYSDERQELARHRLRVHRMNLKGEIKVNPYLHPDSNWYNF